MDDLRRSLRALHFDRIQEDPHGRIPPARHGDDVTHGSPGGRRDDADSAGMGRDGLFKGRIKESLRGKALLQGLESQHQVPGADGHQHIHIELIHTVPLIDIDAADAEHHIPVTGQRLETPRAAGEHHAFKEALAVLQIEVAVARRIAPEIGDLALDLQAAQFRAAVDQAFHHIIDL